MIVRKLLKWYEHFKILRHELSKIRLLPFMIYIVEGLKTYTVMGLSTFQAFWFSYSTEPQYRGENPAKEV